MTSSFASIKAPVKRVLSDLGRSYSSLFFLDSPGLGLGLCAATFLHPMIAIMGVCGWFLAYGLARLAAPHGLTFREQVILYNSLLVSLFVGYLFRFDAVALVILAAAIAMTFALTIFVEGFFQAQGLPVLSVPFAIIAAMLTLAGSRFSNVLDGTTYFNAYDWWLVQEPHATAVADFLRSIGAVLCLPDPLFGALAWAAVTARSPLIGSALLVGFGLGFGVESLVQLTGTPSGASHYFNYSLTFAGISAVLLAPSRFSVAVAGVAVLAATLIAFASQALWQPIHVPITALPFNLSVLLVMRTIYAVRPERARTQYAGDPEETIERTRLYLLRHRGGEPGVFCPFAGRWLVQQGFDGPWTHKGHWRHALDFVIAGEDGKTFKNQGIELTDYHAFGQDVLAPVEGYVTAVVKDLDDNPIGRVENQRNWGNHVIIRSLFGYHVVLAHLKKGSACVAVGDYVTVQKKLGSCGNSGYSQEPHLHLQVQWSPLIGAHTAPFHLLNHQIGDQLHFHAVPVAGEQVEPIALNLAIDRLLTFRVGQSFTFECERAGHRQQVTISVGLDELRGSLYFTDGPSRLSFGRVGAQFFFYGFEGSPDSFLAHLMLAAPRLPISYRTQASFVDHLPLRLTEGRLARWLRLWLGSYFRQQGLRPTRYRFDPVALELRGQPRVHGRELETYLQFDPGIGFQEVKVGDIRYVRKVA